MDKFYCVKKLTNCLWAIDCIVIYPSFIQLVYSCIEFKVPCAAIRKILLIKIISLLWLQLSLAGDAERRVTGFSFDRKKNIEALSRRLSG